MDESLGYLYATLPTSDYRAEIARLNVELKEVERERDYYKTKSVVQRDLLSSSAVVMSRLNAQVEDLQRTCNELSDTGNYREWCSRLLRRIRTFDPDYDPSTEFIGDGTVPEGSGSDVPVGQPGNSGNQSDRPT